MVKVLLCISVSADCDYKINDILLQKSNRKSITHSDVRKLPLTWGHVVAFAGSSGFLIELLLAAIWQKK